MYLPPKNLVAMLHHLRSKPRIGAELRKLTSTPQGSVYVVLDRAERSGIVESKRTLRGAYAVREYSLTAIGAAILQLDAVVKAYKPTRKGGRK